MTRHLFAVVSWCGIGSIRFYPHEHEGREALALLNRVRCGTRCNASEHVLVRVGEIVEVTR